MQGALLALSRRAAGCLFSKTIINQTSNVIFNQFKYQPNTFSFSTLISKSRIPSYSPSIQKFDESSLLVKPKTLTEQVRTVIKYSWTKGKRKSVRAVRLRFFRLHWGIWIRTYAGRFKKLWKKSLRQKVRYRQHIFCNHTQSKMLDTMVGKYWIKPKYYIEDPYAPYHTREEFRITRKKPWRPEGCDYE